LAEQQSWSLAVGHVAEFPHALELASQHAVEHVVPPQTTAVPLHDGGSATASHVPGVAPEEGLLHFALLGHWPPTA
jgi:hypothetical protein